MDTIQYIKPYHYEDSTITTKVIPIIINLFFFFFLTKASEMDTERRVSEISLMILRYRISEGPIRSDMVRRKTERILEKES